MFDLIADEDVDRPIVEKLRSKGFDVFYVDNEMKGSTDKEVLQKAVKEKRVLISFDRDFTEIQTEHSGIVRITRLDRYEKVVSAIEDILKTFSEEDLKNTLVEVSPSEY